MGNDRNRHYEERWSHPDPALEFCDPLYSGWAVSPGTIAQGYDVTEKNRLEHEKESALEQIQKTWPF
jgi:hypothetical protein